MVDTDERFLMGECQRLGRTDPNEKGTDETRSLCDRDRIDVFHRHAGFTQCVVNHVRDSFHMMTRRHFRDDATKSFMTLDLRRNDVRQ